MNAFAAFTALILSFASIAAATLDLDNGATSATTIVAGTDTVLEG